MRRGLLAVWLAVTAAGPQQTQPPAEQVPEWLIANVMRWLPLVQRWHADFPELDPAWVLGVIAQESQGDPYAISGDEFQSTGLMQITPRSWIGTRDQLLNPAYNIWKGMSMLSDILEVTHDIRAAMGAYNCGYRGLLADRCGSSGGLVYAEKILTAYVPVFRAELIVRAGEQDEVGEWLATLGYREGLGNWQEVIVETEESCEELPARRFRPRLCV